MHISNTSIYQYSSVDVLISSNKPIKPFFNNQNIVELIIILNFDRTLSLSIKLLFYYKKKTPLSQFRRRGKIIISLKQVYCWLTTFISYVQKENFQEIHIY